MPRCSCAGGVCSCALVGGAGVTIEGSGSAQNPYVISAEGGLNNSLQVLDTPTIDLVLTGSGTPLDPAVLSANAHLTMQELDDVQDAAPSVGFVPVWDGAQWIFQAPPTAPPGAVTVACGLDGDGSGGNALRVAARTAAQWTTDGYTGTPVSAGRRLYCGADSEVYTMPEHTTYLQAGTGSSGNVSPPLSPTLSSIVADTTVSITNNSARQVTWAWEGQAHSIATFVGGNAACDMNASISVNGAARQVERLFRVQTPTGGGGGSAGVGGQHPCQGRAGTLAPGAAVSIAMGLQFTALTAGGGITFVAITTRHILKGWTV